jgi:RHS repeat-associated protein
MSVNATLKYIHKDHLGGTSVVTSDNGSLIESLKYYSFGETRSITGPDVTDKLFTGQRLDDMGLYYYGARYYDPAIGRFISPDTIVSHPFNPQSFNRYSYCLNNPLKYIDPTGLTDATVTSEPIDPETAAYMALCGYGGYDVWYKVVSKDGNEEVVAGTSADTPSGQLPPGVFDAADRIRQRESDSTLNIVTHYTITTGSYTYSMNTLYHYTFDKGADLPRSWGKYRYNEKNNIWRIENSSKGPESWVWSVSHAAEFFGGSLMYLAFPIAYVYGPIPQAVKLALIYAGYRLDVNEIPRELIKQGLESWDKDNPNWIWGGQIPPNK